MLLSALAALVLAVAAALPSTRWVVRVCGTLTFHTSRALTGVIRRVGIHLLAEPAAGFGPEIDPQVWAAAQKRADNPIDALIVAGVDPATMRKRPPPEAIPYLERIAEGFPERPEPAAAVCIACTRILHFDREAEQEASVQRGPAAPMDRVARQDGGQNQRILNTLLRAARQGDRADPGNGFFPDMEAAALFALRRDGDALQALHRAARSTRWDDYVFAVPAEEARLERRVFGRLPGVVTSVEWAAVLLPHFATVRAAARVAMYHAFMAERRGDYAGGLSIRRDVVQGAAVMGANSRTMILALVAAALTSIGCTWPEGRRPSWVLRVPDYERATRAEDAFLAFVRKREGQAAADWFAARVRSAREARELVRAAMQRQSFQPPYRKSSYGWALAIAMLASCVWCLGMALMAAFLGKRGYAGWHAALLGFIGAACLLWLAVRTAGVVRQLVALAAPFDVLSAPGEGSWPGTARLADAAVGVLVGFSALLPAAAGLVAGKFSGAGPWRGMAVALSAAALAYSCIFGMSCALVARQEDQIAAVKEQILYNELQYAARITGRPLPWREALPQSHGAKSNAPRRLWGRASGQLHGRIAQAATAVQHSARLRSPCASNVARGCV